MEITLCGAMAVVETAPGGLFPGGLVQFLWPVGVSGDEVLQQRLESFDVILVSVGSGLLDVFDDDPADVGYAILGVDQVFPEFCGDNFRYVLMLGDRLDLLFGQFTYTDTVL